MIAMRAHAKRGGDTAYIEVLLVQFWTTWCPYCRRDQPSVENISDEFKDKGLIVLAVDVGEPRKKVRKYLEDSTRSCKIVLMEDTNLAAMFATKEACQRHGNFI